MVPVEVTYIILFVALTIHSALVWNSGLFPYFFLPGILVLPFIFNGRSLVVSIRNTGLLFVDLGRRLWRKTRGTTPVPWGYLFTSWLEVVWLYAGIEGVAGLIGYEVVTKGVNSATAWIEVIGVVVLAGVSFILVVLKWKYPDSKKT